MATTSKKAGQARALKRCLLYERCPHCNRAGVQVYWP
jgi:hypothetical protein